MSISVYAKESGSPATFDVSDYVINDIEAYVNMRERDYSLVTRGVDIVLSYNYPNTYSDLEKFILTITDGTDTITANYVIRKSVDNKLQRVYEFMCEHEISKLKDYKLTYANLHAALVAGSSGNVDYDASDFYGYPNVAVWYAIDRMFDICDISLDIGSTQKLATMITGKDITWDGSTLTSAVDIALWQIKIDENMLYSLNQQIVGNPPNPTGPFPDYLADDEITFFDFVSWFASMFSLDFYPTSTGYTFLLRTTAADEVRTITDNNKIDYTKELFFKQQTYVDWQILGHEDRSLYASYSAGTTIKDVYYEPSHNVTALWYNNLLFMIANPADDTKPAPLGRHLISATDIRNYITPEDLIATGFTVGKRVVNAMTLNYYKETIDTYLIYDRDSTFKHNIIITLDEVKTKIERIVYS